MKQRIEYIVKPQVNKGDMTDNDIVSIEVAYEKSRKILQNTYKPAIVTQVVIEDAMIISTKTVELVITAVEVE